MRNEELKEIYPELTEAELYEQLEEYGVSK